MLHARGPIQVRNRSFRICNTHLHDVNRSRSDVLPDQQSSRSSTDHSAIPGTRASTRQSTTTRTETQVHKIENDWRQHSQCNHEPSGDECMPPSYRGCQVRRLLLKTAFLLEPSTAYAEFCVQSNHYSKNRVHSTSVKQLGTRP